MRDPSRTWLFPEPVDRDILKGGRSVAPVVRLSRSLVPSVATVRSFLVASSIQSANSCQSFDCRRRRSASSSLISSLSMPCTRRQTSSSSNSSMAIARSKRRNTTFFHVPEPIYIQLHTSLHREAASGFHTVSGTQCDPFQAQRMPCTKSFHDVCRMFLVSSEEIMHELAVPSSTVLPRGHACPR